MQLKISLSGHNIQLPLAYSSIVQGFIYNALSEDLSFAHHLHENGYSFNQRKFKLFTFGEPYGKYAVSGKSLIFFDKLHLEVRSVDSYMIQLLYSHLLGAGQEYIGKNKVNIDNLSLTNKTIYSNSIKIKTLAPITVYTTEADGYTKYFSPKEENFYEAIVDNAKRKWQSYSDEMSDFSFSITPTANTHYTKRATTFKNTCITAWHGEFFISGNPELLNFLYNTGLGGKNSQGFGMFEAIE